MVTSQNKSAGATDWKRSNVLGINCTETCMWGFHICGGNEQWEVVHMST